jgi:hypothetical protein
MQKHDILPDDKKTRKIYSNPKSFVNTGHCERSEAISLFQHFRAPITRLLRFARNDMRSFHSSFRTTYILQTLFLLMILSTQIQPIVGIVRTVDANDESKFPLEC